jgi:hypothetical protein
VEATAAILTMFVAPAVCYWLFRSQALQAGSEARKAWATKKHLYDHGWLCIRCGNTWLPETEISSEQNSSVASPAAIAMVT